MKRIKLSLLLLLAVATIVAQKKQITLDQLWTFTPKSVNGMVSMADGVHYTVIGSNGRTIEKIEYASGKKVADLIDLSKIDNCKIESIEGYEINSTETRILLYTESEKIYRHSFKANYYLYDIRYKELKPLSDKGKQRVACFSPDGDHVAYVRDNNIYLAKLRFNTESAITSDGKTNQVLNGVPDWVYEEEFSMDKALEWSPDSKEIAYIRFDESAVKEYSFPLYKASFPSYDENLLYPGQYTYKYPKAGEANSKVSVQVFNIANRTTKTMQTGSDEDIYLPRIKWTTQPGQLGIIKLNRWQNQLDLIIANTASTLGNAVFTDRNAAYVSEEVLDNVEFLPDGSGFVYLGEMDGYSHLHLYSMAGKKLSQLTKGNFDVTAFLGYDPASKLFYYQAAAVSPMQREIYATGLGAKNTLRLSKAEGTHQAVFSANCKYYINTFSSTQTPTLITVHDAKGKQLRVLEDNAALKNHCNGFEIAAKEFINVPLPDVTLNGWMIKPVGFDASKKYPVLIIQYSGPNSQQVVDSWKIGWEQYLATQGYIVVSIDPRGTGARGEEFRKCTYMKLGKIESDDMIEAARYLGSLPFVDAQRLGIWGWSFGGYMTLQCLSKSDLFKMGIAVAPVTNWRFYDTVYTERFMRRPQENAAGYDDNSPINMAKNLNGNLLLIHGTADDNVHFQNSMEYVDKLVQEGKQFDMFVYPNRNHGIRGGRTNSHIYNMMAQYIKQNL